MAFFIDGNSKIGTLEFPEPKGSTSGQETQSNGLPPEKEQVLGKSKSSHFTKLGFMTNKKDKEEQTISAQRVDPMSRWEAEGRADAPWHIVNTIDKKDKHQPAGLGRDGIENHWSLNGEHGSP